LCALAALAGCGLLTRPAAAPDTATLTATAAAAPARCSLRTTAPWPTTTDTYQIEALLDGDSCAKAVAVLVVRAPDGRAVFADALPTHSASLTFAAGDDLAQKTQELEAWIGKGETRPTLDVMPVWAAGAPAPAFEGGNFQPTINRDTYEAARIAAQPLLCYAQGAYSARCVILDPRSGAVTPLGVWING
jgi:hypothetical protein